MEPIKYGYGLTNQLLSFCGLIALATRHNRVAIVPDGRIPLDNFIDLEGSVWPPGFRMTSGPGCKFRKPIDFKPVLKKYRWKVKEVDRKQVALRPHKVMFRYDTIFKHTGEAPAFSVHELFLRYPYEQEPNPRLWVANMICGLKFHSVVRLAHKKTIAGLKVKYKDVEKKGYLALHLRLETTDFKEILRGRSVSTTAQLREFLINTVIPLALEKKVAAIVVCSGPIGSNYEEVLDKLSSDRMPIVDKTDFLKNAQVGAQLSDVKLVPSSVVSPTSTRGAAVDLMIMEDAKVVLATTWSSFSLSIYSKRCGSQALGCRSVGNVFLYDVYLDGTFTKPVEYPCGLEFGIYHRGPPALLRRPPKRLHVVTFRTYLKSPLYVNHSRNF